MSQIAPFGYHSNGDIVEFFKCQENNCDKYVRGDHYKNNSVITYGSINMSFCKEHYRISWAAHPENPYGYNYVGVICSVCFTPDHINWIKEQSKDSEDNDDRHISYCDKCNQVVCMECCKNTEDRMFCPDCYTVIYN